MEKDILEKMKKDLEVKIKQPDLNFQSPQIDMNVLQAAINENLKQLKENFDNQVEALTKKHNQEVEEIKRKFPSVELNDVVLDEKNKLFNYLDSQVNYNYVPEKNNLPITELLKNIASKENQEIILNVFQNSNARQYIDTYEDLFNNMNISDEFKTRLFFILAEQQVDKEFLFRKSFKKFVVNPCKMDVVEKLALLGNIKRIIDLRISIDNPGWANVCYVIAENYFFTVFPDWPDSAYARNSLAYAIAKKAKEILGVEDEINFKEIEYNKDYVEEFLRFFNDFNIIK